MRRRAQGCAGNRFGNPEWPEEDGAEYTAGKILDPDNGKVYSSKIQLTDGGRKLNVRGYIGVSMLGRSQIWERQE